MNRAFSFQVNRAFSCQVNRAFSCQVNRAFSCQVNRVFSCQVKARILYFFRVKHIPLLVKLIKIIKSNGKSQIL